MLRFYLKSAIIVALTEIYMNLFIAPYIMSENWASFACFAGLIWVLLAGILIGSMWMKLGVEASAPSPYQDLIDMDESAFKPKEDQK